MNRIIGIELETIERTIAALERAAAALVGSEEGEAARVAARVLALSVQPQPEQEPVANVFVYRSGRPVQEVTSDTRYTVAVEGQPLTYWDRIHDAITNAQRAVYASVDATTRAIDDLRAGRLAEWSYGFSAVRIYPPQRKAEQEPVAWRWKARLDDGRISNWMLTHSNPPPYAVALEPLYIAPQPAPDALREAAEKALTLIADAEAEASWHEYANKVDAARDALRTALEGK